MLLAPVCRRGFGPVAWRPFFQVHEHVHLAATVRDPEKCWQLPGRVRRIRTMSSSLNGPGVLGHAGGGTDPTSGGYEDSAGINPHNIHGTLRDVRRATGCRQRGTRNDSCRRRNSSSRPGPPETNRSLGPLGQPEILCLRVVPAPDNRAGRPRTIPTRSRASGTSPRCSARTISRGPCAPGMAALARRRADNRSLPVWTTDRFQSRRLLSSRLGNGSSAGNCSENVSARRTARQKFFRVMASGIGE